MQQRRLPTGLSDDGGGVMAANIVEGAQSAVIAANHDNRFTGHESGYELSRRLQLINARDQLPGLAEYAETLKFRKAGIYIPGCGNG